MDARVESALRELARVEPDVESRVRQAWDDLTAGSGNARDVSQWWLQLYVWDQLGRSSSGTPEQRWRVAVALGDLLAAVGLGRYAEIARSETTRAILLASDDLQRYSDLYAAALKASGIQPPDTELITWGPVMGPAEADAYERAADALELSMVSGDLVAGRRGSRAVQQRVTDAVLTAPQRDLNGLRPLHGIASERLHEWTVRSPTLTSVTRPFTEELTAGVPQRLSGVAGELRPLQVLLEMTAEPVPLTSRGYLPPATVAELTARLGADDGHVGTTEAHNPHARLLREAAQRLGLVRVHRKALTATARGRQAARGPDELFAAVAQGWFGAPRTALVVAREVLTAVLATGGDLDLRSVAGVLRQVLAEEGWRVSGGAVDEDLAYEVLLTPFRDALYIGLLEPRDLLEPMRPRHSLLPLLRAALRHHLMHHGLTQLH
ncbi:MAG: hypothetical protein ACLGIV_08525 [Actinomycetes bacterium]